MPRTNPKTKKIGKKVSNPIWRMKHRAGVRVGACCQQPQPPLQCTEREKKKEKTRKRNHVITGPRSVIVFLIPKGCGHAQTNKKKHEHFTEKLKVRGYCKPGSSCFLFLRFSFFIIIIKRAGQKGNAASTRASTHRRSCRAVTYCPRSED